MGRVPKGIRVRFFRGRRDDETNSSIARVYFRCLKPYSALLPQFVPLAPLVSLFVRFIGLIKREGEKERENINTGFPRGPFMNTAVQCTD
jgi:hypothetical protein